MDYNAVKKRFNTKLKVPILPTVVAETLSLLESEQAGTRQVGALISKDPPLTVELLRIANSALYGGRVPILSAEHAAAVLGFDTLRNILLKASVVDLFAHLDRFPGLDLSDLWKQARVCSRVARQRPGTWTEDVKREDAYLCGLLHNIGVFVLLDQLGEDYVKVLETHQRTGDSLRSLELATFQFSHDQIGFLVARRWGLPKILLARIRCHLDSAGHVERNHGVAVTHCARLITEILRSGRKEKPSTKIRKPVLELLGIEPRELDLFTEECRASLAELES